MDYVQEDIGLMTTELHKWEEECRKYEAEMETEKRKSREMLQPLQAELAALEEQVGIVSSLFTY
jgi:cell division protein ZapA (FtsZ GTPase activity inhibitor)